MSEQATKLRPKNPYDPAVGLYAIAVGGGDQFVGGARGVYLTTAGNLSLRLVDGSVVSAVAFPLGWHRMELHSILQTGTTAVGFYFT